MSEPTTVLTDYVLAAIALAVAWRIHTVRPRASVPGRLWAASFLALAVAALVGGTWHGIPRDMWPALRSLLWSITYVAIGVADLLILAGATRAALSRLTGTAVLALLGLRFLAYAGLVIGLRDFRLIAVEFGGTVLLLFVFALDLVRRREPAAGFVLGGALLSFAAGLVLALDVAPNASFNDNDLFHVIQAAGVWLFFQAALRLRVRYQTSVATAPGSIGTLA